MKGVAAIPEALVGSVMVAVPLLNVPEVPAEGAVKTTLAPATGLPEASFTVTASAVAKAVLTVVDCGVVPVFAVSDAADPAVFVIAKVTVGKPAAAAVTL